MPMFGFMCAICLFICLSVRWGSPPFPFDFLLLARSFYRPGGVNNCGIRRSIRQIRELCAALFPDGNAHSVWESVFRHFLAPSVYLLRCSRFSRFLIPLLDECEII